MRSLAVFIFVVGTMPIILMKPHIGVLVFSWISYMNPHRLTWGFAYAFPFAMMIGVLTIGAWLVSKEPRKLPMTTITILSLVFLLWTWLTTILAVEPEDAWGYFDTYFKIMVITFLTLILFQTRERIVSLVWLMVLSIGYFAVKGGVFTILTGGAHRVYGPAGSFIEDNNQLALAVIMIIPLGRFLQLQARSKWISRGMGVALVLMLFAVVASQSRGAFLALAVMGGYFWIKSRNKAVMAMILAVLAVMTLSFMPPEYFERISTIKTYEEDASAQGRFDAWEFAVRVALERPLIGGGFRVIHNEEMCARHLGDADKCRAFHSIYFQVLGTQGFVGLFLFLATFYAAYRTGGRVIRLTRDRPNLHWARDLAAMNQVGLLGYGAGGAFLNLAFFDLPWHMVAIMVLLRIVVEKEIKQEAEAQVAVPEPEPPPVPGFEPTPGGAGAPARARLNRP